MQFRLDLKSGVPVYRQIIDQVHGARASGAVRPGDQLPTVRQLAVDLSINPNTVVRAYRELELTGALDYSSGNRHLHHEHKGRANRRANATASSISWWPSLSPARVARASRLKNYAVD